MVLIDPHYPLPARGRRRPCPNCGYCPCCGRDGGRHTTTVGLANTPVNSTTTSELLGHD